MFIDVFYFDIDWFWRNLSLLSRFSSLEFHICIRFFRDFSCCCCCCCCCFQATFRSLHSLHAALCNCDHMPLCMNECINECLCTVISHNGTCKNNESCQNTLFLNDYCWTRWDLLMNVSPLRAKQLIKPTINYLLITHTGSCCFNLFLFFSFLFFLENKRTRWCNRKD